MINLVDRLKYRTISVMLFEGMQSISPYFSISIWTGLSSSIVLEDSKASTRRTQGDVGPDSTLKGATVFKTFLNLLNGGRIVAKVHLYGGVMQYFVPVGCCS